MIMFKDHKKKDENKHQFSAWLDNLEVPITMRNQHLKLKKTQLLYHITLLPP